MKHSSTSFLAWLALLLAFVLGSGTMRAETVTLAPSDVTYSASSGYTKTATFSSTPVVTVTASANNMDMSQTSDYLLWASGQIQSSTYTISVPSGYVVTGYTLTGTANSNDQTVAPAVGTATTFTSAASEIVTVSGIYCQNPFFTLTGANTGLKITEITVTYVEVASAGTSTTALSELYGGISVGSEAASLTTGQWYVMFDRGPGHGYLYEQTSSHTLYNTNTVPSGLSANNAKYLVRLSDATDGKYYIQNGFGNYFGTITQSTAVPMSASAIAPITVEKIASTDGHFYLQSSLGLVLNANATTNGDATVVGWGTTVPTSTGNNNDWAFYPVTMGYTVSSNIAAGGVTYSGTDYAHGAFISGAVITASDLTGIAVSGYEVSDVSVSGGTITINYLPTDGGIFTISGYVSAGVTIDESTVTDFPIYNNAGTFTVSNAASATTLENLWVAVKTGDTYYFRSAYDGQYLSATAGLTSTAYPYTVSLGTTNPYIALYNSSLGGGRYVASGYANSTYRFGTTTGNYYANQKTQQTNWSTDFLLTQNTDYVVYTLTCSGAPSGETPTLTYGGWTGVTDGDIFVAPATGITENDLTISEYTGYTRTVTIDNTNRTVTVAYTPASSVVSFTDGTNAVSVSVDGGTAASSYSQTYGTALSSISYGSSNYVAYTLNGTTYYGNNNPALLAAIAGLTTDATITVTTATGDITVTDVNGDALSTSRKYFFKNVGANTYAWAADDKSVIGPYTASSVWADNYRYSVEGAGSMLVLKSVSANAYLAASDISDGAGKISPTAATADAALVVNAGTGSTTNGFSLTPAGNYYLNFYASGNLGFWNTPNSTAATNTWQFIPALRVDFVDANGNGVNMRATVGGQSLSYDRTNICFPQGATWTALTPSSEPGLPYVVKYILNGTTYDDRNMSALYTALAALTADATVTVIYGADIAVADINGNALEEGKNYYVKLPGRGEYYFTQNGSYIQPTAYNAAYGQIHQIKGSGEYLALQLPYRGSGYYLGVSWNATALADGYKKVSSTIDLNQALRFDAIPQAAYVNSYALRAVSGVDGATPASNYLSNHSGVNRNMGFNSTIDAGAYLQFIPAIAITVQDQNAGALNVTVDGTALGTNVFYRPYGVGITSLLANAQAMGSTTTATINGTTYTGADNILAAINALTDDATVTFNIYTVTFTEASESTTLLTMTVLQGATPDEPTFDIEESQVLATFTLGGNVYDARRYYRSALCTALAGISGDATVTVNLANGTFSTLDKLGNVLTDGGYYFLKLVGRSSTNKEYFIGRSNNLFKPTTSYSVAEFANNATVFKVVGGSAASNSVDYLRLVVPTSQDTYLGAALSALESSSTYDNIAGSSATNNTTSKVFAATNYDNFITFSPVLHDNAEHLYGLNVVGSNSGSAVSTYLSNIYGTDYPIGFYNELSDAGTYLCFVPAIKVTFTGPNGMPVKVTANDEEHANGIIRIPYGHALNSLTPPTRFATYTIGEESGLSYLQVMERVAQFTSDTQVKCNAYFNLSFLDENGDSISSDVHGMGYTSGYANKHSIGMGCCLTNIILDGYTKLDNIYVLQGEEYDLIGIYEALMHLEVAQGEEVVITVKEGVEEMMVLDIYGNPLVSGNNYYIQFPGRNNYKLQGSISASNNHLGLTNSMSYDAPASNRLVFQPVGNGSYLRLVPAFKSGYYVGGTDVTDGYDKVQLINDADYALKFRAEKNTTFSNCYGLRVANHNGTVTTFMSNYGGTNQYLGFYSTLDNGGLVQFVPYASGITLNFVDTNGNPILVDIYNNTDANASTKQDTQVSTKTYSVNGNTALTNLQNFRYYFQTADGVGLNILDFEYNGTHYDNWGDLFSAGAADGGTVTVTVAASGRRPLDINGNPVVAGRTYRIQRLVSNAANYLTKNSSQVKHQPTLATDGTQYWTVSTSDDFATMQLSLNGNALSFNGNVGSAGTAYVDGTTGTTVNFRSIIADRTTHYYFLEATVNATETRLSTSATNYGFYSGTNNTSVAYKYAFVPVGIVDYYNNDIVADRPYRIEMPGKVGQDKFPAGRPVTLTLSSANSAVTEASVIAASVEQYNAYYWLPDTYTGLDYMYNEKQVWYFEPVSGAEAGYLLRTPNGYAKVASYASGSAVTINAAQEDATTFYGVEAEYDELEGVYGFYTYDPSASSPTKLYLCARNANAMVLSSNPTQSSTRWYADCVFRVTPLKSQTLSDAYTNRQVLAKGWDCYGPGKGAKGLEWIPANGAYAEAETSILETRNWLQGVGDHNDSIIGYHLPDVVFLAYDYAKNTYMETVDFTAPTLIGYTGSITSTMVDGYYEFTGYQLKKYPILASPAPTIGSSGGYEFDMANTYWYMIDVNEIKDQDLINNQLMANVQLSSITNPFVDKYLFCFVGDEENGYLVYNKAQGAAHFMGPRNAQARWYEASNIVWIDFATSTEEKRNKSRILFQCLQHDGAGYYTFVDRYSGLGLDRWSGHIVYWHGRPILNGGGYADNASNSSVITTDYQKTQLGDIPNSFYRGSNRLYGRTMGFPSAADTYSRLITDAVTSGYLSSMIGYVGLFRSQEDIDARYAWYQDTIADLAADQTLNESQYKAALVKAYDDFFGWLKERNTTTRLTNGVEFLRPRYYYLKSVSDEKYLAVTSGNEGDASYNLTLTDSPETTPGAVWQFEMGSPYDASYFGSELNTQHFMHNIYWNAYLATMTNGQDATLVLESGSGSPGTIDVYNDMTVMENPGQFVLRTAVNGYVTESNTCLSVINGNVEAHSGHVGGGQRRWYIVPLMTETPASTDDWEYVAARVEEFSTVNIPTGYTWTNGTTIANTVASDLVFTTYCNPDRNVAFPHNSNFYAFRADYEVGSQAIHLEQLDDLSGQTIPAGMGVVILAPNGKTIPFLPVGQANVTKTTSLLESAGDDLTINTVDPGNYVFVYKKSGTDYVLRFYKVGSKGATLGYHRAYLPSSALDYATRSLSAVGFSMLFDDGTVTRISLPMTDTEDEDDLLNGNSNSGTFDLQGRRVDEPTEPGVYIVNGRKVYVK